MSNTYRFTRSGILAMPLPTRNNQVLYPDPELPGHCVRVTKNGSRSYVVDRQTKRGRIRVTLGAAGTDMLTTVQSRELARVALGMIAQGCTPDQIRYHLSRIQDQVPVGAMTFNDVMEQMLRERKHKLSERTQAGYRQLVETHLRDWKNRPIESIDEQAVVVTFTSIKSPARANCTFRVARAVFNYAQTVNGDDGNPVIDKNPVTVLSRRKLWHTIRPRQDVVSLAALPAWWEAVMQLEEGGEVERDDNGRFAEGTTAYNSNAETIRDFLIFLLMTGLRRDEAATLKWADVDLRGKLFTVEKTKNRDPHTLPLGAYLHALLKRRHAAMLKLPQDDPKRAYVFAGEKGPLGDPKKTIANIVAVSGVQFSSHTLRRTFATVAESIDIPYYALKRLLNHRVRDVTLQHYLVISCERLREPMQRIEDFILKAAGATPTAKVETLRRPAGH